VGKKKDYKRDLLALQVELVKLQRHIIAAGERILVILEGRDAAGKDGAIKRIVQHLSPREVRVVALGKPTDREASSWYFQRYVAHLPAAEELVLFNRSWYNRAGVEPVMGYCTAAQTEKFLETVPHFEQMLVQEGIRLFKYYLDISRDEQAQRLEDRRVDPLKQWKVSPVDSVALEKWQQYSDARNVMLARTHTPAAPWHIVRADNKRHARLNIIRDLLSRVQYDGRDEQKVLPDPSIVFPYDMASLDNGDIAP
jgi:polyphosphate kinase 2